MCGISGVRHRDGAPVEPGMLRGMADRLRHRGPDGEGIWCQGPIGFGHRRLAIIDVAGSPQPMSAGGVHVCFNGEIFNYAELRRELVEDGYSFRSQGDTEVLLALYRTKGPDSVHRLDGQFAYAIYDESRAELWLFRDRIGILPLYYYCDSRRFVFASEIKAILAGLDVGGEVDPESVREYLAYRSVPPPHTLFRGIWKLPPGHRLCLGASGEPHVEPYWSLPRTFSASRPSPDDDAVERTSHALEQAVRSRLVADVPVGAYLSGGVDSSLIVALMRRARGDAPIETFAAGFGDPRFDELAHARRVSELMGTRHTEVLVDAKDFGDLWHRLTWHRDAPISEPADVAIFRLASEARERVKVLLSGEGSDELFAGYPKYRFAGWAGLGEAVPNPLREPLFRIAERALPNSANRLRIMLRAMSARSEADRVQTWFAPFTAYERRALFPGPERETHREIWQRAEGDRLRRMLYFDCHTWLVDNLLERGDRMSMAASVESRPPFLDHHVVELAFSLPSSVKLRGESGKWVVKEVARRHLPGDIVDRAKVGFRVPLDRWFRTGLRDLARDLLLARDSFVGSQMDRRFVARLIASHETGRRDESLRIWTLLGLEVWYHVFLRATHAVAA